MLTRFDFWQRCTARTSDSSYGLAHVQPDRSATDDRAGNIIDLAIQLDAWLILVRDAHSHRLGDGTCRPDSDNLQLHD